MESMDDMNEAVTISFSHRHPAGEFDDNGDEIFAFSTVEISADGAYADRNTSGMPMDTRSEFSREMAFLGYNPPQMNANALTALHPVLENTLAYDNNGDFPSVKPSPHMRGIAVENGVVNGSIFSGDMFSPGMSRKNAFALDLFPTASALELDLDGEDEAL